MYRSAIEEQVAAADAALRLAVDGLDPDDIPAREAVRIFEGLDRIVRTATAARTLLARRVEDSMEWKRLGYGSAAEHIADKSGKGLGAAKADLDTSNALRGLEATRQQMLEGAVSPEQGAVIAGAAKHNPGAEADLLDTARNANLQELRNEALKAKTAVDVDPAATHARIRRERRLVRFTDAEGARHLNLQGPVDEMAIIEAEVDRQLSQLIRTTPAGEPLEGRDARAFDAAIAMARRSEAADGPTDPDTAGKPKPTRPQHLALLRLDVEALWRGHVEGDELCEVTGLGPIPVAVARHLLGDAVLKLILTRGQAVAHVTSLTRGPTQAMRYALLWTSPTCTVEGCTRTIVEHDHIWGAEYKDTRHTKLHELERHCHVHHDLHTLHGWALLPGAGKRPMVAPDDPRHPCHATGPPGGGDPPSSAAAPPPEPLAAGPPPTSQAPSSNAHGQADLFGDPAA